MSDSKPIASLSPKLLARKGGARPAMRPTASALAVQASFHEDDLGWNDMGHDDLGQDQGAAVYSLHGHADLPDVVRRQRRLAKDFAGERRSALADGRRAAFTLRVDADRHLKLRLACTVQGRSAQTLVTEALDRLLDELPDVAQLAAQLAKKHN